MSAKAFSVLLLCMLFSISFCISCSSEKEKKLNELHNRIVKERNKNINAAQDRTEDEAKREKQVAVADACVQRYNSCVEKCSNSSCEGTCQKALSVCEKDLPRNLQTIK